MSSASDSQGGVLRFGVFEVDLAARELRKRGVRVKLQDQPFRVLEALLERPGEIVTREQLKERLWAQDEFVEFDKRPQYRDPEDPPGPWAIPPRARGFLRRSRAPAYRFVAPVEPAGLAQGAVERAP